MPGLVPDIHVFGRIRQKHVDGRVKPGHDHLLRDFAALQLLGLSDAYGLVGNVRRLRVTQAGFPVLDAVVADLAA